MINFNNLQLRVNSSSSFVGIKKEEEYLYFYLPKGFTNNLDKLNNFNSKRDLFFLLYRVVDKFMSQFTVDSKAKQGERLNLVEGQLSSFLKLIDTYDELKILSFVYRFSKSNQYSFNDIHLWLHQGVYLSNGAVYIDYANIPRQHIHCTATDIVAMYCYILREIHQQLEGDIKPEIAALAVEFQQKYLTGEGSLFEESSYEQVQEVLKDSLAVIDHNTSLKDAEYWDFYEAIELFLYGDISQDQDGIIWGISEFHSLWESLILTYILQTLPPEYVLFFDREYIPSSIVRSIDEIPKLLDVTDAFNLNNSQLIPDTVIFSIPGILEPSDFVCLLKKGILRDGKVWNDYGYKTSLYCSYGSLVGLRLKIGYVNQKSGENHSYEELIKYYSSADEGYIKVTSPLPRNFYSFWDLPPGELIEPVQIQLMVKLHHIFYVAFKQGFWCFDAFYNNLLCRITDNWYPDNVFTNSLFRDLNLQEVQVIFEQFITRMLAICNLEIIDAKYLPREYFFDKQNIEDIKSRSVRKQFVYEYLLQRWMRDNSPLSTLRINSSFWIPEYQEHQRLFTKFQYLEGYIDLYGVNWQVLVRHYLSTAVCISAS